MLIQILFTEEISDEILSDQACTFSQYTVIEFLRIMPEDRAVDETLHGDSYYLGNENRKVMYCAGVYIVAEGLCLFSALSVFLKFILRRLYCLTLIWCL